MIIFLRCPEEIISENPLLYLMKKTRVGMCLLTKEAFSSVSHLPGSLTMAEGWQCWCYKMQSLYFNKVSELHVLPCQLSETFSCRQKPFFHNWTVIGLLIRLTEFRRFYKTVQLSSPSGFYFERTNGKEAASNSMWLLSAPLKNRWRQKPVSPSVTQDSRCYCIH